MQGIGELVCYSKQIVTLYIAVAHSMTSALLSAEVELTSSWCFHFPETLR